jgi:hypothetical protein
MAERDVNTLIPPPTEIRSRLARVSRERLVLEKLLKLAVQAEEDRRFCSTGDRLGNASPRPGVLV